MLSVWQRTITDSSGNVIPDAEVTVKVAGTETLPDLFADAEGTTPITNPFNADTNGFAQFYVGGGVYDITASGAGSSLTWPNFVIGQTFPVDSVDDLRALVGSGQSSVNLLGYSSPGDGGGGTLYWDATSTETDNGGTVFKPDALAAADPGRWKRNTDGVVDIKQFGADPSGSVASESAINAAADWCRASGDSLVAGESDDFLVGAQVNLKSIKFIRLLGAITSVDDTFIPVRLGHVSNTGYQADVYMGVVRSATGANPSNPNVRIEGAKGGRFSWARFDYVQLWADSDSSTPDYIRSLAYCNFFPGETRKLEIANNLTTDGSTTQWINENRFFGGRFWEIEIKEGTYNHNHNVWYCPTIEGASSGIYIRIGRDNVLKDVRAEALGTVVFGPGTESNIVHHSAPILYRTIARPGSAKPDTFSDDGIGNIITSDQAIATDAVDLFSLSEFDDLYGADNDTGQVGFNTGVISKSGSGFQILSNFSSFFESKKIPSTNGLAFRFDASDALFRVRVKVFDAAGNQITSVDDPELLQKGNLQWSDENNEYVPTTNVDLAEFSASEKVGYLQISIETGSSVSGSTFSWCILRGLMRKSDESLSTFGALQPKYRPDLYTTEQSTSGDERYYIRSDGWCEWQKKVTVDFSDTALKAIALPFTFSEDASAGASLVASELSGTGSQARIRGINALGVTAKGSSVEYRIFETETQTAEVIFYAQGFVN